MDHIYHVLNLIKSPSHPHPQHSLLLDSLLAICRFVMRKQDQLISPPYFVGPFKIVTYVSVEVSFLMKCVSSITEDYWKAMCAGLQYDFCNR